MGGGGLGSHSGLDSFLLTVYTCSGKWSQSWGNVWGVSVIRLWWHYKNLSPEDMDLSILVGFLYDTQLRPEKKVRDQSSATYERNSLPTSQVICNKKNITEFIAYWTKNSWFWKALCLQTMISCRILRSIELRDWLTFSQGSFQGLCNFQWRKHNYGSSLLIIMGCYWLADFRSMSTEARMFNWQ